MAYFALLGFLLMASLFLNGVLLVRNIGFQKENETLLKEKEEWKEKKDKKEENE